MVRQYYRDAAPAIQPEEVEMPVVGDISGVRVQGVVDLLDVSGRLIDIKTAKAKPSGIPPKYRFQVTTYRMITPGANGRARVDTLVKTKTLQLHQNEYEVTAADVIHIEKMYPLAQEAMRSGLYAPNRESMLCSGKYCAYWEQCEAEFGGRVDEK
jgi:hypothetical protein